MLHTALVILGYGVCWLVGIPFGIFAGMWILDRMMSDTIGRH